MKKKVISTMGALLLGASLLAPTYAGANTTASTAQQQEFSVSGYISHAELTKKLQQIQQSSKGVVNVEVVGHSNRGREIYKATVGTGKKVVLIQTEIHGNEKTGTVALLNILQKLGTNSPEAKKMREEMTVVVLPMMNPDASELDRRGNDITWQEVVSRFPQLKEAKPSWNYYTYTNQYFNYTDKPGFDVNRDFHPDLNYVPQAKDFPGNSSSPGWYITPEAQTVRDVYKSLQAKHGNVDVFVDMHHQGTYYVEGTDDLVTMSISGKFVEINNGRYEQYKSNYDLEFSKQLNLAAYHALQSIGNSPFNNITLYDQNIDLPGTALGSFALNGSGTVLFEVRGQTHTFGQKKRGQLVQAVETGLYGILHGVTDDSVHTLNAEEYDRIPKTAYRPGL
ncbi:M14 family zinc carboxypeptidase [Bacillus sp. CGMCC 1.16541]|uniref:M14 family zinc carboxypeptidase n=1 Tax=Bacillus sp. CGMCC 1.16541 TaxID=2185143 RepID=UPI000D732C55|nr:M14 family zinc carboxypeptidase [Bacillus sp. CGMCC 1.16541]